MSDEVYKDQINRPKPENTLRDRIAEVIDRELDNWMRGDGPSTSESDHVAQAIIDDLGLHYVSSKEYARVDLDWTEVKTGRRIAGEWEQQ